MASRDSHPHTSFASNFVLSPQNANHYHPLLDKEQMEHGNNKNDPEYPTTSGCTHETLPRSPIPDKLEMDLIVDTVVDYISESTVFGSLFLGKIIVTQEEKRRSFRYSSYVDCMLLVCIILLQPLLYGFFVWSLTDHFTVVYNNTEFRLDLFCPEDETKAELTDTTTGFFIAFIAVFCYQAAMDLKGTLDVFFIVHDWYDATCNESPEANKAKSSLLKGLPCLLRANKWAYVDQVWHIIGWHFLTGVSVTAMYFESEVGGMILNATAVIYLERMDDLFKARILSLPSTKRLVKDFVEKCILKQNDESKARNTNPDEPVSGDSMPNSKVGDGDGQQKGSCCMKMIAESWLLLFHLLFLTALFVTIGFLINQTVTGCRPIGGKYKLFG